MSALLAIASRGFALATYGFGALHEEAQAKGRKDAAFWLGMISAALTICFAYASGRFA